MKVAIFNSREYERTVFERENLGKHELLFLPARLTLQTADAARGCRAVCCFANDQVNADVIHRFKELGIGLIALRSAGYNHVDLEAARACGMPVVRVPDYSPYAVAEHAVALLQTLNRKVHRAFNRVRELNFSLEGLVGFDLHGKTVGVIGGGRIGAVFCKIMAGFGCRVLLFDLRENEELKAIVSYVGLPQLFAESDVISLHVPLTPDTHHILNQSAFERMKSGVFLINTGRGGLVDSRALIRALKSQKIGGAALDVYEEEENVFFKDLSSTGIDDDVLARLLTFPNVLVTSHQAFLTHEALTKIAQTTLGNISAFGEGRELIHRLS